MVFHGIQIGGFTDDDTRLRAAQELVAAESHDIAASVQHFADRRFMRQSPCGQIDEQAAADIVDAGQSVVMGQAGQVRSGNTLGKTDDAVITGVDLHEGRRIFADGPFVVGQMSLVGRTDFADTAAALFDDVGNPEGAADFDEFPPRHDDFPAGGHAGQGQEDGSGIVIDDDGIFGTGQLTEKFPDMVIARSPLAGSQVVF